MGYLAVNRVLMKQLDVGILKAKDIRDTIPSKGEEKTILHEVHMMSEYFSN